MKSPAKTSIGDLNFNPKIQEFLEKILKKYGNYSDIGTYRDIHSKKNNLGALNLISKNEIERIGNLLKNKKVVIVHNETIDSTIASKIIIEQLNNSGIEFSQVSLSGGSKTANFTEIEKHINDPFVFDTFNEKGEVNDKIDGTDFDLKNNLSDFVFICVGKNLSSVSRIQDISSTGANVILIDNSRVGNDYIKTEDVMNLKTDSNITIVNQYIGDYDNKQTTLSNIVKKVFPFALIGRKPLKYEDSKLNILNTLSVLSKRDNLSSYENRVIVSSGLEELNNTDDENVNRKLQIIKEAIGIDEFDIENVETKLIPFLYGIQGAYKENILEDDILNTVGWTDFSEVIDFVFESSISENEFKDICRTVIYTQDKNREHFSEMYSKFLSIFPNISTNGNITIEFNQKLGKINIDGKYLPEGSESYSLNDIRKLSAKMRDDTNNNILISIDIGDSKILNFLYTGEKQSSSLKKFVKENKDGVLSVSGEDKNYSFTILKPTVEILKSVIENFENTDKQNEKDGITVENWDFLSPEIVKTIKRDLGVINPSQLYFTLKSYVYQFKEDDAGTKTVIFKDNKGNKKSVSVNSYYFNYLKENYPVGDEVRINIKTSIRADALSNVKNSFLLTSIADDDFKSLKEIKQYVNNFFKGNKFFESVISANSDKSSFEILYKHILALRKSQEFKSLSDIDLISSVSESKKYDILGSASKDINDLKRIASEGSAPEQLKDISRRISDFVISLQSNIDSMLDLERERLLFGGSRIIPFLVNDENSIFISSRDDRKTYDDFLNKRNELFFDAKKIREFISENFKTGVNNSLYSEESQTFIKNIAENIENLISEKRNDIRFLKGKTDGKDLEISVNEAKEMLDSEMQSLIVLLEKQKEIKNIISKSVSLRTSIRNYYFSRYTKENGRLKTRDTFSDFIINNKKAQLSYESEKMDDALFYSHFLSATHIINTVRLVYPGNNEKLVSEVVNYLNENDYSNSFDTIIDAIRDNFIGKDIVQQIVSKLSYEAKYRLAHLAVDVKNQMFFRNIFDLDILETNEEIIKDSILSNLGIQILIKDSVDEIVNAKISINNAIDKLLKDGKKSKDIVEWLNNGEINGVNITEIIKKGLNETNYLNTGWLILAYVRDLSEVKKEGESGYTKGGKILNSNNVSTLSRDLIFMRQDDKETGVTKNLLKVLSEFKRKDTILSAMNKEMSLFLSNTNWATSNKNTSIVGYFKNIFNVYGLQSTFISEQLKGSAYMSFIHDEIKKTNKELISVYRDKLAKGDEFDDFNDFLRKELEYLGTKLDDNYNSTPFKTTTDSSKIGLRKYGFYKLILILSESGANIDKLEDVRDFISEKLAGQINYSVNNYTTSQSESFFIFNIQRKLFNGFTIEKTRTTSYKDIYKEIFSILSEKDREKLFKILSKINSYGKNIIPDFIIRNQVGNICAVGEIFGGHSDDSDNYEVVKKIKTDILTIFKNAGINTFSVSYDESLKNKKINEFLYSFDKNVNKSLTSKDKSLKEYFKFINVGDKSQALEQNITINNSDINKVSSAKINKMSIESVVRALTVDKRTPIFFDTETTGFERRTNPDDMRGASIFQLAYSDRKGEYISKEFSEIKGPLKQKIEKLTHQNRSDLLKIGQNPVYGMGDFLLEIVGEEIANLALKPEKSTVLYRRLDKARSNFAIVIGHNSFAFDASMISNMISSILVSPDNEPYFKENPGMKVIFSWFNENGFDMGDTLVYARNILSPNKNPFIGDKALGNSNNKLGNLYKLSQIKLGMSKKGANSDDIIKKVDEKIEKFAHNAQFDIEMTKEVFDYIASTYTGSEKIIDTDVKNLLKSLSKGDLKWYQSYRDNDRALRKINNSIVEYNGLMKLLVLELGKTDSIVEYENGSLSIHRISDYNKIKYSSELLTKSLIGNGYSKEDIDDMGIVKEAISKNNIKVLSNFISSGADLDNSFIDFGEEKLVIRDNEFSKLPKDLSLSQNIQSIKHGVLSLKDNEDAITKTLNAIIIKKKGLVADKKRAEVEKIRHTRLLERMIRDVFQLRYAGAAEFNTIKNSLIEHGVFISENEQKISIHYKETVQNEVKNELKNNNLPFKELNDGGIFVKSEDMNSEFGVGMGRIINRSKLFSYEKDGGTYIYKKGNSISSFALKRASFINIEKLRDAFLLSVADSILDIETKEKILDILIEKKISNKDLSNNFNNTKEIFKGVEDYFVKIVRQANFLKYDTSTK